MPRLVLLVVALALPAVALAAGTDPQKRFTAADKAKAASIVLKRSDFVVGWKKAATTPSEDESDFSCPGYNPDQSDLVLTGEAEAEFDAPEGVPSVYSVANVYKTRREAVAAWTRGAKPGLVPCAAKALEEGIEEGAAGVQATVTRKGRISFPAYSPRTIAYRFSLSVRVTENGQTQTVPFTVHIIALGHGRGDAMLMTFGVGPGLATSDLKGFAQLTAQRLAAAKL